MPRGRSKYKPGFSRHSKDSKPKDYNWWMHVSPTHRTLRAKVRRGYSSYHFSDSGIEYAPVIKIPFWIIVGIILLLSLLAYHGVWVAGNPLSPVWRPKSAETSHQETPHQKIIRESEQVFSELKRNTEETRQESKKLENSLKRDDPELYREIYESPRPPVDQR